MRELAALGVFLHEGDRVLADFILQSRMIVEVRLQFGMILQIVVVVDQPGRAVKLNGNVPVAFQESIEIVDLSPRRVFGLRRLVWGRGGS